MVGKMSMLRTLMGLAVSAMLINLAMATNFTVGGPNGGWDTSTNLQGWASSQAFEVGDNLIFQYGGNHNVLEVTRADYDSCQTSNPLQMFSGGTTIIPLASAVNRYFICGTAGHCGQGMNIEVDILAASSPTPSAPPPSTPSTPPPASPVTPPTSSPPPQTASPPSVNSPPSPPTESPPLPEPPVSGPGSDSPANSPPPSVTSPPPPSSATKVKLMAGSTVVLGFVTMMILTLRI